MKLRSLAFGTLAVGMLAVPQIAEASWGQVAAASALNLRACPSVACPKVAVMPRGAQVWIDGSSGGWYHLVYNGVGGYASARYIAAVGIVPQPYPYPAPVVRRPPPPPPTYYYNWWGPRYPYWYSRPGIYFGFRFGN